MRADRLGFPYLLTTVVLFSTYEVVSKTLVGKIDPFQINFIRFFVGGAILFFITLLKADIKIGIKDMLWVSLVGILNVTISMNLLQLSLYAEGAKASIVAVIFSSNPIFVVLFSAVINKEKISLNKVIGLIIGLIGIIVIFIEKLEIDALNFRSPLLAFFAAVAYGLYTVIGGRVSSRIGSLKMNAYSFIIGSLFLLPLLLSFHIPVATFDVTGIWQVLYLSVFVTGLAYLAYFKGLAVVGASKGSLIFFAKPVLASLIAIIFLRERPTLYLFAGTFLIIAGITAATHWTKIKSRLVNRSTMEKRNLSKVDISLH